MRMSLTFAGPGVPADLAGKVRIVVLEGMAQIVPHYFQYFFEG
jgi:hypothetical protein